MKKSALLHPGISEVIASLGHDERLAIVDAGMPIPLGVERIDLALSAGVPGLIETIATVLTELEIDSYFTASEMAEASPRINAEVDMLLRGVPRRSEEHRLLRAQLGSCRAVIRTGEFRPYANVILVAGVVF